MANQIAEFDGEELLDDSLLEQADEDYIKKKREKLDTEAEKLFEVKIDGSIFLRKFSYIKLNI